MPPAGCASPSSTMTSAPPASSSRISAGWVATSITSASGTSGAGRRPIASRTLARVSASWLYTTTFMKLDGTDPEGRARTAYAVSG
jgi:N-acetyl-gamma-glutamylphosphate reductase